MELRTNELCRRDVSGLTYADSARRAMWEFADATTADGHRVDGSWSFSVAIPADVHDRRMVAEVLMHDRDVLTVTDVVRHLDPVLTRAVKAFFATTSADDALTQSTADRAAAALADGCRKAAFASGLEVLPPFDVRLRSATLEAEQARAEERARAEADATERAAHLRRAAELSSVMMTSSTLPPTFLETVAPTDRAAALGAALATTSQQAGATAPLWVVAGRSILRIELSSNASTHTKKHTAAEEIGALRCIQQVDTDQIAVGGQRGIELLSVHDRGAENAGYLDDQSSSTLGYNAVAPLPNTDEIWATHSQAGVVCWRRGEASAPVARFAEYAGAGGLVRLGDDTLAFFAGPRVHVAGAAGIRQVCEAQDEVIAIVPDGRRVHVLCEDGQWMTFELPDWRVLVRRSTGGRLSAATALAWLGGIHLLLARREGEIECYGVDDTVVTRYASRHVGARALAASATHVAALTADRQRVLIWSTIDGRGPVAEINVTAQTGNRAAGIAFGWV